MQIYKAQKAFDASIFTTLELRGVHHKGLLPVVTFQYFKAFWECLASKHTLGAPEDTYEEYDLKNTKV